jgi:uncharacterized protein (TIGR02453 family)
MANRYFTPETFAFLTALANNNNRDWFEAHRQEYEATVRTPALAFIGDMAAELALISPHFLALPKKVGGSLMRVHRDTRFGKDKRPYKCNIGIHFRHEVGKDVHAPGYYLHIESGNCFAGVGIWRPDADALGKIRDAIIANDKHWLTARDDKAFRKNFTPDGEVLTNPPRGYAKDHPLINDLKRKDFIAAATLSEESITSTNLLATITEHFEQATPYMSFLCKALELRF